MWIYTYVYILNKCEIYRKVETYKICCGQSNDCCLLSIVCGNIALHISIFFHNFPYETTIFHSYHLTHKLKYFQTATYLQKKFRKAQPFHNLRFFLLRTMQFKAIKNITVCKKDMLSQLYYDHEQVFRYVKVSAFGIAPRIGIQLESIYPIRNNKWKQRGYLSVRLFFGMLLFTMETDITRHGITCNKPQMNEK